MKIDLRTPFKMRAAAFVPLKHATRVKEKNLEFTIDTVHGQYWIVKPYEWVALSIPNRVVLQNQKDSAIDGHDILKVHKDTYSLKIWNVHSSKK